MNVAFMSLPADLGLRPADLGLRAADPRLRATGLPGRMRRLGRDARHAAKP